MTDENVIEEQVVENPVKLAGAAFYNLRNNITGSNPWSYDDVDKMEAMDLKEYQEVVKSCRFFYKHDSIISTVFNKMIDLGITDLIIPKKKLASENEYRILYALKDELENFAEVMALEYLVSGLVVPEVKFAGVTRDQLKEFGIKRYETLTLPVSMWLRDPAIMKIEDTILTDKPSYFVRIPDKLRLFIQSEGRYPDGGRDLALYQELLTYYPEFVQQVREGEIYILIDNPNIIRRRYLSDSPYPIPYLYSVLEPLKHKRNLRRMDYSIASRVISAIQLFNLGSDEFPVTEDQGETQFESIKNQMYYRNSGGRDVEKIFQLFANHTLQITWIYPPVEALLDETKYAEVNQDIIFGLGFPRILITGEAQRTGTSNPEFAMISPLATINNFRKKILKVINVIVDEVIERNNLRGETEVKFDDINLKDYADFVQAMTELYKSAVISRTSFAKKFGFDWEEESELRVDEDEKIEEMGLQEFAPQPFSPAPSKGGQPPQATETEENTEE